MTLTILTASDRVACPHCNAQPGEPCRIINGVQRGWPHVARSRAAQNAVLRRET